MKKPQKLSAVALLTLFSTAPAFSDVSRSCGSVRTVWSYESTNEKPYAPEDDVTDFNDLAVAGHQLRTALHEEVKNNHFWHIFNLATTYQERRSAYEYYRNQCDTMLKESYQDEGHKIRSSWKWRDYAVATAVVGTCVSGTATIIELAQQEYLLALSCAAVTTGAFFAWGYGADWADDARFTAAYELEKKLRAEKECTEDYKELAQKRDQAEINLIQAYTRLKISNPWTDEAKAVVSKVTLPEELYA